MLRQIAKDANGLVTDAVSREQWLELQMWLSGGEHRVWVPFADDLADLIEPEAMRLRRDMAGGGSVSPLCAQVLLGVSPRQSSNRLRW